MFGDRDTTPGEKEDNDAMHRITTLAAAEAALAPFWPHNNPAKHRYSLDFMVQLMDFLGNPQDRYKVVHVAGTSGKTSTAYYAAALLRASGKRVGLTVSPHVDALNERVQIDGQPLAEKQFCAELSEFLERLAQGGFQPTYFELLHAFAFWEFARQRLDYAVVEVGVGGLLDGTNVMTREDKVCVLTDIGLDHTKILGDTIPEIAVQKAGIILPRSAVFCYRQSDEVMAVFQAVARQQQADLHILPAVVAQSETAMLPAFQQRNFGLALAAVEYIAERDGLPQVDGAARQAAAQAYIPARMEIIPLGGKTLILDAAHNGQKLQALTEAVRSRFPAAKIAVLSALLLGREGRVESATQALTGLADHLIVTQFSGPTDGPVHAVDPEDLRRAARAAGLQSIETIDDPAQAFATLLERPEPVVVVAGSFYLLNHVRPLLKRRDLLHPKLGRS